MATKFLAVEKNTKSSDTLIGYTDMTPMEREYRKIHPYHSYKIRSEWDPTARDFMAYWNGKMQKLLKELGHPSARPIVEIDQWMTPVVRDGADPYEVDLTKWREYEKNLQDAMDREKFEKEEKEIRASGGGYSSTRNHADGRILNERGETVGRWDDNEDGIRKHAITRNQDPDEAVKKWREKREQESVLEKVCRWVKETQYGTEHVERWQRAANGIVPGSFPGVSAMTLKEAENNARQFIKSRWNPVVDAMRAAQVERAEPEEVTTQTEPQKETPSQTPAGPKPDFAKARAETPAPALTFEEETYKLEQEAHAAAEHPFINPNRIEIPFRFSYDSCVGEAWYYHEEGLKKDRDAYLKDPVWLRWLKAVDATDADVVPMERKEVNIKQEEWMGWHKHGAAMTSYLAAKRRWEESGGKSEQEEQVDWAKRTEEILANAPKSTPAALEAAIQAGDWHKVAELAKKHAEVQIPPSGYVWFGRVRQGSIESGQYIAIGDGVYDEAILYLASSWAGEKPSLIQQNALNGPCRVHHSYEWVDTRHEGPYLLTWEEIRARYNSI